MADLLQTQWIGKDIHRARSFFDLLNSGPPNATLGDWRQAVAGLQTRLARRDRGRTSSSARPVHEFVAGFHLAKSAKHPLPAATPMDAVREIDSTGRPMGVTKRPWPDRWAIGALGLRGAPWSTKSARASRWQRTHGHERRNSFRPAEAAEGTRPGTPKAGQADLQDHRSLAGLVRSSTNDKNTPHQAVSVAWGYARLRAPPIHPHGAREAEPLTASTHGVES